MSSSKSPTCVRVRDMEGSHDDNLSKGSLLATDDVGQASLETPLQYAVPMVRSDILELSGLVGKLSVSFLEHVPWDPTGNHESETRDTKASCHHPELAITMRHVLSRLETIASRLSLNVVTCILKKMDLNRKKYPVDLCKGKAGKYTEYSAATGITAQSGQSTLDCEAPSGSHVLSGASLQDAVPELTRMIREFAWERRWNRYHLPRNLLLALLGELGELAEVFQWSPDESQPLTPELLDKAGQEIADVAIYLLRLADVCRVGWCEDDWGQTCS